LAPTAGLYCHRGSPPANSMTVVAEDDTRLVGFVHVVFDDDYRSCSLIDNLQPEPPKPSPE
jgi:hypothetical protein